jgi:hypothetical protein
MEPSYSHSWSLQCELEGPLASHISSFTKSLENQGYSYIYDAFCNLGSVITIPGARTWPWGPVFQIRRPPILTIHTPNRAIAAENRIRSMPIQSLAASITNTPWHPRVLDSISAEHRPLKNDISSDRERRWRKSTRK